MAGTATVTHRRAATIAAAILALPLAAAPCGATSPEPPAQGRWRSEARPALTLDIARCAEGWCGVIVEADGRCGPRALTVRRIGTSWSQEADGRLVLPDHRRPYLAQAALMQARSGEWRLSINGVEDGTRGPIFARRIFPVQLFMSRIGDAVCAPPVS